MRYTYSKLIISDSISAFGDRASELAFLALAYQLTRSAWIVAAVALVQGFSYLLSSLIVGAISQRVRYRKQFLMLLDLARALLLLSCSMIESVYILYVFIFSLSLLSAMYYPLRQAGYQLLIPSEDRVNFISRQQMIIHMVSIGAPIASAWVIAAYTINAAFYIDAASFIVAGIILYFTPSWVSPLPVDKPLPFWRRTLSGFSQISQSAIQKNILHFRLVLLSVLSSYQVIYLFMITKSYENANITLPFDFSQLLAYFSTISALGLVLGSYFSSKIFSINNLGRGFVFGIICISFGCFFWSLNMSNFEIMLMTCSVGTFAIFFGVALLRVSLYTAGQEITPAENFVQIVSASDTIARAWQYLCGASVLLILNMASSHSIFKILMGVVLLSIILANRITYAVDKNLLPEELP